MRTPVRWLLALAVTVSVLGPPGPAAAGIPHGRQGIGDSVMLGAAEELRGRGIRVNAVVSRQFRDVVALVRRLRADGRLRRKVIVHLGHNGILIDPDDCDRLAGLAGARRTVYLLTLKIPRWYRRTQNRRLAACASRHANTRLLDWFAFSHDHPGWFADDGFHLTPRGQARYAAFVDARTS